jgi:hypothetical protein
MEFWKTNGANPVDLFDMLSLAYLISSDRDPPLSFFEVT